MSSDWQVIPVQFYYERIVRAPTDSQLNGNQPALRGMSTAESPPAVTPELLASWAAGGANAKAADAL